MELCLTLKQTGFPSALRSFLARVWDGHIPPELLPPVLWGFAGGAADLGCLVGAEWWERGVCSVLMDIPTWFQTFLKAPAGDFKCS